MGTILNLRIKPDQLQPGQFPKRKLNEDRP